MLEAQLRAHAGQLQWTYDRMPYPLQSALTSVRGWFLTRNRYSRDMHKLLRELRSHERWNSEQVLVYQRDALQKIVNHARATVPYYAAYPRLELHKPQDIASYPVLSRDTVRENPSAFVARDIPEGKCVRVGTTGTTGASLRVAYTESVARKNWAFHMRRWAWAGVKPRTPRVTFFGSRIVPPKRNKPPFWTHNLPERQTLASIFHLSEANLHHYVDFLRQQSGKVLEGFPSVLAILSDFVLKTGKPIPMQAVFTDGEPLYPFLREAIEHAFAARVSDLYGNTEACGLIHECEVGRMHAAPDYAYLEILDGNDRPVEAGQEGYLVWTGFVNETMPLIRYRIGDRGCWETGEPCACGRVFPLVVPTITRDSDLLWCPDGRIFSPRALNQALKGAKSLRFCQLVHERSEHLVVRGVSNHVDAFADVMTIRKNLQNILGKHMSVSAMLADAPIVRAGGKSPLIIQPQTPKRPPSRNTQSVIETYQMAR